MPIYTTEKILKSEPYEILEAFGTFGEITYKLSSSETKWLEFVRGRYSIADYIDTHTDRKTGLTCFIPKEFSKALDEDCKNFGKAVCLADDTALQKILWSGYIDESERNNLIEEIQSNDKGN